MPQADRAGFPTYWQDFGTGSEPALLIHCSLAHSGSFRMLAAELDACFGMTAFDLPGHGRSGAWDGRGEIQETCAHIAADFLEGPATLIGHSFGATVALRLAVMRPELVRRLVLIEPVFFAVALRDRPEMREDYTRMMAGFETAVAAGDMQAAARDFTAIWGGGSPWAQVPQAQRDAMAGQVALVVASAPALHDDTGGLLAPGILPGLPVPVLLMQGAESPPIIDAINAGLAARLPCASRATISGAGHMLPITHPQATGAAIRAFAGK